MDCARNRCNFECWSFVMCITISFILLLASLTVMLGAVEGDKSYWSNFLTLIIGLWMPNPKIKKPEKNDDQDKI